MDFSKINERAADKQLPIKKVSELVLQHVYKIAEICKDDELQGS